MRAQLSSHAICGHVEGGRHVAEHALGHERAQLLRACARQLAAHLVQLREARRHAGPDLGVVGRGVELQLERELVAIREQRDVGLPHAQQTLVRAVADRRAAERLGDALEGAVRDGEEERLLGPEQPHDVRLRDAGALGDAVGRRAVEATARELDRGCRRDLRAPLIRGVSCRFLTHSLTWYQSITTIGLKVVIDQ